VSKHNNTFFNNNYNRPILNYYIVFLWKPLINENNWKTPLILKSWDASDFLGHTRYDISLHNIWKRPHVCKNLTYTAHMWTWYKTKHIAITHSHIHIALVTNHHWWWLTLCDPSSTLVHAPRGASSPGLCRQMYNSRKHSSTAVYIQNCTGKYPYVDWLSFTQ